MKRKVMVVGGKADTLSLCRCLAQVHRTAIEHHISDQQAIKVLRAAQGDYQLVFLESHRDNRAAADAIQATGATVVFFHYHRSRESVATRGDTWLFGQEPITQSALLEAFADPSLVFEYQAPCKKAH